MAYIQIQQIKMDLNHTMAQLELKALGMVNAQKGEMVSFRILKKSWDARKKQNIQVVYSVLLELKNPPKPQLVDGNNIMLTKREGYAFPSSKKPLKERPIVVGSGPAGLFAALLLAEHGYAPLVLERGEDVETRLKDVNTFFEKGLLKEHSNIQFGEGGAGTYSDGKINTQIKDPAFRKEKVLEAFVEAGAPEEILYINKPHIGTDYLVTVVKNLRNKIVALGGEVRFRSMVTELLIENDAVKGVVVNNKETLLTSHVILAIGHSARDTFEMLKGLKVPMEQKAFAIGLRIEHPQEMIQKSQFGEAYENKALPVADYKLTHHARNGRGVYSFCMCPGGYVVNSASEKDGIVCNGMSYFKRDSRNANSAILVNVMPEDFGSKDLLAGVEFQRKWERQAFQLAGANYHMPLQLFGDFYKQQVSTRLGEVEPTLKGKYQLTDLNQCLPPYVTEAIKEGVMEFNHKIKGFARWDAVLTGVETRSSSPIRVLRNDDLVSSIKGLYPCGEGAGYAGGIMSAAMDGIKVAEKVATLG